MNSILESELTSIKTMNEKESQLRGLMRELDSVLVAFSGGVDSSYLALIATSELGAKAVCAMGISPSVSTKEKDEAAKLAKKFSFNFVTLETSEFENPEYTSNPTNRCYFCKSELYDKLAPIALESGAKFVLDGLTTDDLADFRPGRKAAQERGVRSPLVEAGLSKTEIRALSKQHGLPTWDKPSSPCLSSRIAYGIPVTIERLAKVETGEGILRELGFKEFRVRYHGELVRIEIAPAEMESALKKDIADELASRFREIGFKYVTLDLHGFRRGAMNEVLKKSIGSSAR